MTTQTEVSPIERAATLMLRSCHAKHPALAFWAAALVADAEELRGIDAYPVSAEIREEAARPSWWYSLPRGGALWDLIDTGFGLDTDWRAADGYAPATEADIETDRAILRLAAGLLNHRLYKRPGAVNTFNAAREDDPALMFDLAQDVADYHAAISNIYAGQVLELQAELRAAQR